MSDRKGWTICGAKQCTASCAAQGHYPCLLPPGHDGDHYSRSGSWPQTPKPRAPLFRADPVEVRR